MFSEASYVKQSTLTLTLSSFTEALLQLPSHAMLSDELPMFHMRSKSHDLEILCIISDALSYCVDSGNKQSGMKNIGCVLWYVKHIPVAGATRSLLNENKLSQRIIFSSRIIIHNKHVPVWKEQTSLVVFLQIVFH